MPAPKFRPALYVSLAAAVFLPACALADSAGTYLTWQNKTPAAAESQDDDAAAAVAYPAPPSPYGQVGDPFRRNLNWPSKKAPQAPQSAPKPQAVTEAPRPYQPAHAETKPAQAAPVVASRPETPKPAPQVTVVAPTPPPPPVLSVAKPVTAPHTPNTHARDTHTSTASISAPTPLPAAKPVVVPPQAVATAPAPKPQPQPITQPAPDPQDNGYQVPATSKYAAQIKAARATQAKEQAREQARQQAADQATAPEESEQLAVQETDHVFIPGETYKSEGDAPRLYSLHRMYGLQPDPITVTPDATGAILDGADLHADEAPKAPAKEAAPASGKDGKTPKAKTEGK